MWRGEKEGGEEDKKRGRGGTGRARLGGLAAFVSEEVRGGCNHFTVNLLIISL
jgi:ribosomal protein L4